jgi:DNA (cytosine-5)-methyltransferase 1
MDPDKETFIVSHALTSEGADASEDGSGRGAPLVAIPLQEVSDGREKGQGGMGIGAPGDPMYTLQAGQQHGVVAYHLAQVTSGENRSNPQPGDPAPTLNGDPQLAIAFQERGRAGGRSLEYQEGLAYALTAPNGGGRGQEKCIAYQCHGSNVGPMGTLRAGNGNETGGVPFVAEREPLRIACDCGAIFFGELETPCPECGRCQSAQVTYPPSRGGAEPVTFDWQVAGSECTEISDKPGRTRALTSTKTLAVAQSAAVRRLTPRECERLQGYPDDWTRWDAEGNELSDSARYRMIGNGVTKPVGEWIGRRLISAMEPRQESA